MKRFFRAQLSSIIATLFDFIVTLLLVELAAVNYSVAMVAGALAGAATNFMINRHWSFSASRQPAGRQSFRYLLVWTGSLLLNIGGTFACVQYAGLSYITAKLMVALIVGWSFNYLLQKKFVFAVS